MSAKHAFKHQVTSMLRHGVGERHCCRIALMGEKPGSGPINSLALEAIG